MFSWFFVLLFICHLCYTKIINAQTPITAILSTYLIHEFLVNVKCRIDGFHTGICHLPLASLKELHLISLTYTETP